MEHLFGSAPFAIGVEEELLLVAADPPHPLEHHASDLIARIGSPFVKPDLYEAMVECASSVCADAAEAAAELELLRDTLRDGGATLAGAGLHPAALHGDVVHVPDSRYDRIHATMRGLVERTPTCALHVHVGMPDPETAIAVYNRLRAYLPLLQALAAHSPFWYGRDSGFATARAQLFRGFPRAIDHAAVRQLGRLRDDRRRLGRGRRAARLHVPVVGHPAASAARHRRGAGDGRPVAAGDRGRPRRARARPRRRLRGRPRQHRARRGAHRVLLPRRPRRPRGHDLVARRPAARARGGRRGAGARPRVRSGDALDEVVRVLRDGNGADRMRHAHAVGGLPAVLERLVCEAAEPLYGYTRTTVPMRTQL